MTLIVRRPAVRPITSLLTALVLASTAAVAMAAESHAAKPIPMVNGHSASCRESQGITTYRANFNLSANKGKWVFVKVDLQLGTSAFETIEEGRVETTALDAVKVVNATHQDSTWRLTFMTRKGAAIEGATVTEVSPHNCTVLGS